jgi:type II secretory ATPase GspE/PulE/Tfp pilus assembly ATPase PilB-like protein
VRNAPIPGYAGRLALYEVLPMTDEMRSLVMSHAYTDEIRKRAIAAGMAPLRNPSGSHGVGADP